VPQERALRPAQAVPVGGGDGIDAGLLADFHAVRSVRCSGRVDV
jgi:hypothetical protein